MAKPIFTTCVNRADGSTVEFDSLPAEEKKKIAEAHNRKAIETVANSEGLKVQFVEKGTA